MSVVSTVKHGPPKIGGSIEASQCGLELEQVFEILVARMPDAGLGPITEASK